MDENTEKQNNKQPRFNFTWLYVILIAGLAVMVFGGDSNSASKTVDYSQFKEYISNGYASGVLINKDELTLNMFVDKAHERAVFGNVD